MYADTAPYYDLIHESRGRKAGEEATVVLAEARRRRRSVRSLLDAGCGTGVHLPFFASAVEEVVGFDASPRMLEVARGRAPNAELHQGDFRTFDLGRRFDAIVCLFSSIGYLVDEADLRSAISNFSRHLEPGGVLLVEGWVEPEFWLESTVATEAARADGLAVARAVHTRREGSTCELSMRYLVAMPGSGLRTIDEHHRMRLSDPGEVEAAYLASGLTFERLPHMLHAGRSVFLGVRGDA